MIILCTLFIVRYIYKIKYSTYTLNYSFHKDDVLGYNKKL